MNIDYSQFYRGTTNIPSYGSGAYKKDTLVKYEFNTTDEYSNKIELQKHSDNTSISRYVWLPIEWEGDKPVIRWQKEWTLEQRADD